ncbi:MAG: hypothetical protein NVSMB7_16310 [Chitinophagaceae bacterium]
MNIHGQIQYLTQQQVDKEKWDACIASSPNGLIYGYSFYLDQMAKHWDALILNDYEAVMPLTWNKKWGVLYLYQPPFTQQLGIFSRSVSPEELLPAFISIIKKSFRFAEISLNFKNTGPGLLPKTNFILPLHQAYHTICKGYSRDADKNIRRSKKFQLQYGSMDDLRQPSELYKNRYASRTKHIKENDYYNFEQMCLYAMENKMLVIRKVTDREGVLLATALFLKDTNRLYLLQSTTLPAGRLKEANYFLLDNIIREFSNQKIIFDFEGSDIPGIAHFYKNFGAVHQPYYFFRYNRLPWPLRLFK